jgi:hypothetical protein
VYGSLRIGSQAPGRCQVAFVAAGVDGELHFGVDAELSGDVRPVRAAVW